MLEPEIKCDAVSENLLWRQVLKELPCCQCPCGSDSQTVRKEMEETLGVGRWRSLWFCGFISLHWACIHDARACSTARTCHWPVSLSNSTAYYMFVYVVVIVSIWETEGGCVCVGIQGFPSVDIAGRNLSVIQAKAWGCEYQGRGHVWTLDSYRVLNINPLC